jgi:dihydroorotase
MASYAKTFEEENALDRLEKFASLNGPAHYGLKPNDETVTLERRPWVAPEEIKVAGPDERALIYRGGETLQWQVVAS